MDVGEIIPYAKKAQASASGKLKPQAAAPEGITLKSLWPEPDWASLFIDGVNKQVLA